MIVHSHLLIFEQTFQTLPLPLFQSPSRLLIFYELILLRGNWALYTLIHNMHSNIRSNVKETGVSFCKYTLLVFVGK